ncbi:hypothetical protein ACN4EG_03185 [Alkalinema pantanalense CENA528]|uniref:hypothetical protein n=1 Tax=Alkalinema pantanalense TaxID=1620705 RepID=UPI003D6FD4DD
MIVEELAKLINEWLGDYEMVCAAGCAAGLWVDVHLHASQILPDIFQTSTTTTSPTLHQRSINTPSMTYRSSPLFQPMYAVIDFDIYHKVSLLFKMTHFFIKTMDIVEINWILDF